MVYYMHMARIIVKKSAGGIEIFDRNKLCSSLQKSGAPADLANGICKLVAREVTPNMSTQAIFRKALRYLVKEDFDSAVRYNLVRGLAQLGPTGFYFEQFIEALLQAHDYTTQRGVMVPGECIMHEVDVLAKKGGMTYIVEGKYRNERDGRTHVDQVMYADARVMDIERAARAKGDKSSFSIWVITNTRFTETAIRYAECRGVKLVGWNYPNREGNLEDMIIRSRMYPVTVLPSVTTAAREIFMAHNIILAQDLLTYTEKDMVKKLKLSSATARALLREAHSLLKV